MNFLIPDKMTDNEIIKALEWHSNNETHCSPCPYEEHSLSHCCVDMVIQDALSLINRQKAEKEALIAGQETLQRHIAEQKAEIDRLTNNLNAMYATLSNSAKATRHEAIKEFAERLKDRMFGYYECLAESAKGRPYKGDTLMDYEVVDMIEDSIDNLVKEMVGDK